MGDRSNLFFRARGGAGGIGIYAHSSGTFMADAAMAVLKNKAFQDRLGDTNYALRIGVQTALEALMADSTSDTGFGLWTPATGADDNEYRYIVIDIDDGAVFVAKDWKKPKPSEKVAKPTAAVLRKKMSS
ncbi:MAG: hypothetical protein JNM17_19570 [Archangium sp.]|nr:hypothetical protein [Archangium sp.]